MALRLGDTAPDFTQDSTEGSIQFHQWAAGSWVVLFSHPADFTPVCTSELIAFARAQPQFEAIILPSEELGVGPHRCGR